MLHILKVCDVWYVFVILLFSYYLRIPDGRIISASQVARSDGDKFIRLVSFKLYHFKEKIVVDLISIRLEALPAFCA